MFRSRSWFGGKNTHSLEHLKYLHNVLSKNQTVSDNNRSLLVETLRSIAEILIWGDQNDSSVFDFFLEKNMLSFFLKILKQKCGSYVCVQLLQTLNILFENIRNETSLYYLLSNNHVNSIIVHKFDFSDEEVMAYYISFLKTLSLKLNSHTIHFFYNDHTNDFPLYTEAIKFFKHPESMVRIAVRTLTLNVFRVPDASMLKFIRNKTAVPYFSNLVWFIGNHVLELDSCFRNEIAHSNQGRLSDLVAEYLDHLHYLNDILCLNIEELNDVLIDHLLNKLFLPLYIYSLLPEQTSPSNDSKIRISSVVSLFLLSQIFLIMKQEALVNDLAQIILKGTSANVENGLVTSGANFVEPDCSLEECFDSGSSSMSGDLINVVNGKHMIPPLVLQGFHIPELNKMKPIFINSKGIQFVDYKKNDEVSIVKKVTANKEDGRSVDNLPDNVSNMSITDEEKEKRLAQELPKLFLEQVTKNIDCLENDYAALFSLCLLYAISCNSGIERNLIDGLLIPSCNSELKIRYSNWIVQKLINIITLSCEPGSKVRLVTLQLTIILLERLIIIDNNSCLSDAHLASIVGAKEESTSFVRSYYKRGDIFIDMFEAEDEDLRKKPLNVEWLMMDSNILLPPTGTPLTGIEFNKRLPCGEVERARKSIRVFLLIRRLSMKLSGELDTQLPLTNRSECVQNETILDLNNSDLLSCHVVGADGVRNHRFLVIEANQIILVVPVPSQLGFGCPKLSALLHDVDVTPDKQDSKSLYISAKFTTAGSLVNTKFIFDDSIRCLAAQQRLVKGRKKAKDEKIKKFEKVLDIPSVDYTHYNVLCHLRQQQKMKKWTTSDDKNLPSWSYADRRSIMKKWIDGSSESKSRDSSSSRSRESSPKSPRPKSEEIPLDRMKLKKKTLKQRDVSPVVVENPTTDSSADIATPGPSSSSETSFTDKSLNTKKNSVETI